MLRNIRIASLVSSIEGLIIFIWLASIPLGGGMFSPIRLASLLGILVISLGGLVVFIHIKSENRFTHKIGQVAGSRFGLLISWLLTAIAFSLWVTILHRDQLITVMDESVYTRLLPLAVFGMLLFLQAGILLLIPNVEKNTWKNIFAPVWKTTVTLMGCFLAFWGLMSATHIGFIFDDVGLSWGPPGTPLTFVQVNLVFVTGILLAFAYGILKSKGWIINPFLLDAAVVIGLWMLAAILWWNEPVSATHFNPHPMDPNFETYPNSDALIFDKSAHHLLDGIGFRNQLVRRPLYVGMLALFHKAGGIKYDETVFLQILVLALIPSLIYLLVSKLSNQLAGLIAGGLILLREKNAIELSDKIVTSNAKLMMSDMTAMLGVIAFVYVMIRVLSERKRSPWLLGIAGACLGLTVLVRAQALILVPAAVLFLLLERRPLKTGFKDSIILLLGLALVISPWVVRNWNLTGTFVLDDRGEEKLLARNYSQNPFIFPPALPGETDQEYSARIKREVFLFIFEHPSDVAMFVSNHFLRNLAVSAVQIVPVYSTDSPHSLVERTGFWDEWRGSLSSESLAPIFIALVLVALGIGTAAAKYTHAGWFPFAVFLFYSAGNALVRSSGWRFSLPVDWVALMYYSIAIAYLPSTLRFLHDRKIPQTQKDASPARGKFVSEAIVLTLLFLAGASVPIAERIIPVWDPSKFTDQAKDELIQKNILTQPELVSFLEQEKAVLFSGKALYPRYVTSTSRIYLAYMPKEYSFLHFWLINAGDHQVALPLNASPGLFPHTSTVTVLGCKQDGYIVAWAVIEHTPEARTIVQEPRLPLSCPLLVPPQN